MIKHLILILVIVFLISNNAMAYSQDEMKSCFSRVVLDAGENQTVGELRKMCEALLSKVPKNPTKGNVPVAENNNYSAIKRREEIEKRTEYEPFVLTSHKTNYILFAAYNFTSPNAGPFKEQFPNEEISLDNTEVKFQISFKFPVLDNLFSDNGDIYIGYTNRSFWQIYNKDASAPFRDTSHEPEAWISFHNDWEFMGFRNVLKGLYS